MSLATSVARAVENVPGVFGVAAHDWATGERLSVLGDRSFITASVIKLPILLAALDRVQHSALRLDDRIELEAGDRVGGSGLLYEFDPGVRLSLHDYLTAMIVVSDNSATNLALRLVGVAQVNAYLDSIDLPDIRSHRPIRYPKRLPGDAPGIGTATPDALVRLLDKLIGRSILTPNLCDLAVDILKRQQHMDGIPRYLPEAVAVGHKDGWVSDVRADAGILFVPGRAPISLAVMADGLTDPREWPDHEGFLGIARIARIIYDAWVEGGG